MKKYVRFEEFNGGEFLGSEMNICGSKSAEYEIILRDKDDLFESIDCGVVLERDGVQYHPSTHLNSFSGVNFRCMEVGYKDIQLRIIKLKA